MSITTTVEAQAEPVRVRPANMTTEAAIAKFVAMRDRIAATKAEHVKQLAPFQAVKDLCEAWLIEDLNAANLKSVRSENGTAFKTTRTSATVENWDQALQFIKASNAWELLEHRVSKTAVEAIIADTQQGVPGVKITRETVLNVRKA